MDLWFLHRAKEPSRDQQRSSTADASPCWNMPSGDGNVAETCRVFGISRTSYYEWKNGADLYGLDALMPKERRAPQMP